jgi:4-diphosphocytidyl-2-C-methyl-D-erythritol kinase
VNTLRLPAPAKLNLMLHITGRREDGYHQLQTVFQLLEVGDSLTISTNHSGELRLSCPALPMPQQQNLAWRAARLLQQHSGSSLGADITLDKRLPTGGGLGGGSSNAATVLLALNRLWRLDLSLPELARLGLQLGADVPVFVLGSSAWAEGIGEILDPVQLPQRYYLVITPNCAISTAEVFSHRQLTRHTSPITIAHFFDEGGRNDCQAVVRQIYPEVDNALIWLAKFGQAQLTGTGACIFAAFESEQEAEAIYQQLPAPWRGFVAAGINQSPVHGLLE